MDETGHLRRHFVSSFIPHPSVLIWLLLEDSNLDSPDSKSGVLPIRRRSKLAGLARFERATSTFARSRSDSAELQARGIFHFSFDMFHLSDCAPDTARDGISMGLEMTDEACQTKNGK